MTLLRFIYLHVLGFYIANCYDRNKWLVLSVSDMVSLSMLPACTSIIDSIMQLLRHACAKNGRELKILKTTRVAGMYIQFDWTVKWYSKKIIGHHLQDITKDRIEILQKELKIREAWQLDKIRSQLPKSVPYSQEVFLTKTKSTL